MSAETAWIHPTDMTLRDFQGAGLAVPGTLVEFHDRYEGGTRTSLIGHMNDLLGLRDDCPEDHGAQVVRYRRVWSPDAAPSATRDEVEWRVELRADGLVFGAEFDTEANARKAWADQPDGVLVRVERTRWGHDIPPKEDR